MASPFPGMDPYIEGWIWGDFHSRLITAIYDSLSPRLPDQYVASTELFVWRVDDTSEQLIGGPDVHVKTLKPAPSEGAVATISAPYTSTLAGVVKRQKHIQVVDLMTRRIVTVIECLSPANKTRGENGQAYRAKREEYIASGINLVEIDLLRHGIRAPLGDPPPPITDYYVLVCRSASPGVFGVWPFSVRDPIPSIIVPLDPDVPEITIELKPCIDHVYDLGRFHRQLDYSVPPKPPLREPDAAWARELLAVHLKSRGTGA